MAIPRTAASGTRWGPAASALSLRGPAGNGAVQVVDIWTGEMAIIASTRQQHMSEEDALHMARLLNRSVKDGGRSVRR